MDHWEGGWRKFEQKNGDETREERIRFMSTRIVREEERTV